MAIILTIEVSDRGLDAARNEIAAFLSFESSRSGELAGLGEVVLRKLLMQIHRADAAKAKAAREAEAKKPKPTIRQMRRAA